MPLLGQRIGGEIVGVGEAFVEDLSIERRDIGLIEDEHIVRLDVDAAETEVRRADQDPDGLTVFPGDEHFVMLETAEMRALHVAGSR